MSDNPKISVFTATFNRQSTLHRVFDSLTLQTYRDFEWIVVDDGSSDGTDELVANYKTIADFPIHYHWQQNRGKHTAYNVFARLAVGEYFCSIDSDDEVLPACLGRMLEYFESIPAEDRSKYAGVMCLAENQHHKLIGDEFFPEDLTDNLVRVLMRHKKLGDKGGLVRVSVLKEFPFPEDVEKVYVPESYHIHGYSSKYKTKYLNEILIRPWTDPRPDHLSLALARPKNFPGTAYGLLAWPKYSMRYFLLNPRLFIAVTSKYTAVALMTGKGFRVQYIELGSLPARLLWIGLLPLGLIRYALLRFSDQ